MTRGLKDGEPNGRDVYPDIIDHPHWQSPTRPRMSLYERAAQFSSFDALAGYSDMISEESRLVDRRIEPSPDDIARLNEELGRLSRAVESGLSPTVTVTYFVPDPLKTGGKYETARESLRRIDPVSRKLILNKKVGNGGSYMEIPLADVLDLYPEEE